MSGIITEFDGIRTFQSRRSCRAPRRPGPGFRHTHRSNGAAPCPQRTRTKALRLAGQRARTVWRPVSQSRAGPRRTCLPGPPPRTVADHRYWAPRFRSSAGACGHVANPALEPLAFSSDSPAGQSFHCPKIGGRAPAGCGTPRSRPFPQGRAIRSARAAGEPPPARRANNWQARR